MIVECKSVVVEELELELKYSRKLLQGDERNGWLLTVDQLVLQKLIVEGCKRYLEGFRES